MKKFFVSLGGFCFLVVASTQGFAQDPRALGLTKEEYYNLVASERGLKPLPKSSGQLDRKRSVLDIGGVEARIANHATLGYDRWDKCWEFPARSRITYRWTMAPLIGGLRKDPATGQFQKLVASGTWGAFRKSEDEYQPLPGYDAGYVDEVNNIGIAFSDKPESWPNQWPTLDQLPEHARKVQYSTPKVGSRGFPGVLDGEVVAPREVYFAVTDNDPEAGNKPAALDIRVDLWGLQYDDILNRNFVIFRQLVTNVGTDTLFGVYIGIHDDPDCPEQGNAEWTDDYAAFFPVGTDVAGFTPKEDTLLWNFTYLWDGDDKAEGFIPKGVGWVGLKFLETPINPATGQPTGVTALRVFEYSAVAQGDEAEYDDFTLGIMPPRNVTPHPKDITQTANSYGPDITYVVGSGPFTLAPGQSLPFAFASIHGANQRDLFNSAMLCQLLYNANYQSAESPPEPRVTAVPRNKQVILYWDDRAEGGIYYRKDGTVDHVNDRLTRNNAFEGYKIFKSSDRGVTWGEKIIDVQGAFRYWRPVAQYDLKNEITGESTLELGRYFYRGDDTGLQHVYVDNNVSNGYEYWYAVVAYDHEDGVIPPLENSIKSGPYLDGDNTVAAVPIAPPSGFTVGASRGDATLQQGRSTVPALTVETLNPALVTGHTYQVRFDTSTYADKRFSVLDEDRGTYVITIGGDTVRDVSLYDLDLDNKAIFDGVALVVEDVSFGVLDAEQVSPQQVQTLRLDSWAFANADQSGSGLADDYEVRFTGTSYAARKSAFRFLFRVPFQVWNVTQNVQVACAIVDQNDGTFDIDEGDAITIVNVVYDTTRTVIVSDPNPLNRGLKAKATDFNYEILFDTTSTYASGDVFRVNTNHPFGEEDVYEFSTVASTAATMTANDLKGVTTVPNPFVVSSPFELLRYGISKELQFHNLPPVCTIRVYTIAGEHIATIEHTNGTPLEKWNLQSSNGQEIAFGVYVFHIDAPGIGESIGKFAVIK